MVHLLRAGELTIIFQITPSSPPVSSCILLGSTWLGGDREETGFSFSSFPSWHILHITLYPTVWMDRVCLQYFPSPSSVLQELSWSEFFAFYILWCVCVCVCVCVCMCGPIVLYLEAVRERREKYKCIPWWFLLKFLVKSWQKLFKGY